MKKLGMALLSLMIISTATFAINIKVECPPPGIINIGASYLDSVTMIPELSYIRYDVYSKNRLIKVDERDWAVGFMVQSDKMKDFNVAFSTAQTLMERETYVQRDKYAFVVNNAYFCGYYNLNNSRSVAYAYSSGQNEFDHRKILKLLK